MLASGRTPLATSACAASALGYDGFSFSFKHETDGGEFPLATKSSPVGARHRRARPADHHAGCRFWDCRGHRQHDWRRDRAHAGRDRGAAALDLAVLRRVGRGRNLHVAGRAAVRRTGRAVAAKRRAIQFRAGRAGRLRGIHCRLERLDLHGRQLCRRLDRLRRIHGRFGAGGAWPCAGACRRRDFAVCAAAMEKHAGGQRRARPDDDFEGGAVSGGGRGLLFAPRDAGDRCGIARRGACGLAAVRGVHCRAAGGDLHLRRLVRRGVLRRGSSQSGAGHSARDFRHRIFRPRDLFPGERGDRAPGVGSGVCRQRFCDGNCRAPRAGTRRATTSFASWSWWAS